LGLGRVAPFSVHAWPKCHSFFGKTLYSRALETTGNGGLAMRVLIACALIVATTIGLGGCFGHHEKAVVTEPLKLG